MCTYKPFKDGRLNKLEVFNELGLIFITDTLFLSTLFVDEGKARFDLGWIHVGLFLLLLVINLIELMINTVISGIITACKKRKRKVVKVDLVVILDTPT